MRDPKTFARCMYEIGLQFLRGSIGDTMHEHVQLAVAFFQFREYPLNVFILANVAHESFRPGKRQNQILRLLLQALILVCHCELCPSLMQRLRNRPGNAAFIGDSEDDGHAAFEAERHGSS
jgi:hypothetical protein